MVKREAECVSLWRRDAVVCLLFGTNNMSGAAALSALPPLKEQQGGGMPSNVNENFFTSDDSSIPLIDVVLHKRKATAAELLPTDVGRRTLFRDVTKPAESASVYPPRAAPQQKSKALEPPSSSAAAQTASWKLREALQGEVVAIVVQLAALKKRAEQLKKGKVGWV